MEVRENDTWKGRGGGGEERFMLSAGHENLIFNTYTGTMAGGRT